MGTKSFFIDTTKCTACRSCQVACKQWNELPAEKTTNRGTYQNPADLSAQTYTLVRFSETSADGMVNGLFTGTLLQVWNGGKFKKDYRAFHRAIVDRMPPVQTPNYYLVGLVDRQFEMQLPFTI